MFMFHSRPDVEFFVFCPLGYLYEHIRIDKPMSTISFVKVSYTISFRIIITNDATL